MRRTGLFLLAAVALSVVPRVGAAQVFSPETFTLDNGMQVVVVSNHRAPVLTHMVWYKVGSADEEKGKTGLAHYLEHLMFKGTHDHPEGEFSRLVAQNGGRENAFTSYDFTAYFQDVAKDRLEMVMRLEADRMTNLTLTPEVIEPERLVILEERSQRTDNNPAALLAEHMDTALFMNHPYANPIIGWESEIKALSLDDITAFYRRWYAPNNAVLAVSGDITAAELRPLAEAIYGSIPPRPVPARIRADEPPHHAARRVTLTDEQVREPSFRRSYLAPGYLRGETEHAYALQVLDEILSNASAGRLYRPLVIERELAVSAGSSYRAQTLDLSQFHLFAGPRPGVSLDDIERAVDEVVAALIAEGVTDAEVERAKARMIAHADYARDSFRAGARSLGAALAVGLEVADVEAWPERIAAVTAAQVTAAARAVLDIRRSVTGLLLPERDDMAEAGR